MSEASRIPPVLSGVLWISAVLRAAPEFPGRNWTLQQLRGVLNGYDAQLQGGFGAGLRFEGNPQVDANSLEPLLLR